MDQHFDDQELQSLAISSPLLKPSVPSSEDQKDINVVIPVKEPDSPSKSRKRPRSLSIVTDHTTVIVACDNGDQEHDQREKIFISSQKGCQSPLPSGIIIPTPLRPTVQTSPVPQQKIFHVQPPFTPPPPSPFPSRATPSPTQANPDDTVIEFDPLIPSLNRRDEYRIGEKIEDTRTGRIKKIYHKGDTFAAKILFKSIICSPKDNRMINNLNHDLQALAQLRHPNIVRLIDCFENREKVFMIIEYCRYELFHVLVQKDGRFDLKESLYLFLQIVDAIRYAHSKGIMHRDLKPENILLKQINPSLPLPFKSLPIKVVDEKTGMAENMSIFSTQVKLIDWEFCVQSEPSTPSSSEEKYRFACNRLIETNPCFSFLADPKQIYPSTPKGKHHLKHTSRHTQSLSSQLPVWKPEYTFPSEGDFFESDGKYDLYACQRQDKEDDAKETPPSDQEKKRASPPMHNSEKSGPTTRCGSPHYAAPEVVFHRDEHPPYTNKADIWSLGVILYTLCTGCLPFTDDNLMNMFEKIGRAEYRFSSSWNIDSELKQLIAWMIQVDPTKRPTADELMCKCLNLYKQAVS